MGAMNIHELHTNLKYEVGYAPLATAVADTTAMATGIIDVQGVEAVEVVIITGILADADATFAITVAHGDAANLSDTAAAPAECIVGDSAFTFDSDGVILKVGIIPWKGAGKRYWRVTVTPTANSGAAPLAMLVLKKMYQAPAVP